MGSRRRATEAHTRRRLVGDRCVRQALLALLIFRCPWQLSESCFLPDKSEIRKEK